MDLVGVKKNVGGTTQKKQKVVAHFLCDDYVLNDRD